MWVYFELTRCAFQRAISIPPRVTQDYEWSPAEPVMAIYIMEQGNQPARISLMKVPERTELRQKNLFNVSGAGHALETGYLTQLT